MNVGLVRTGEMAGKSGLSPCGPAKDGRVMFERGFAFAEIPDEEAKAFLADVKAGKYPYRLMESGEGPNSRITDRWSTTTEEQGQEEPETAEWMTMKEAQALGFTPQQLKPVRRMSEDTGKGKSRTLLHRGDVLELKKAKED